LYDLRVSAFVFNLATGALCLLSCAVVGWAFLHSFRIEAPQHWFFPLALLCGVAVTDTGAVLALVLGGGVRSLHAVLALVLAGGILSLIQGRKFLKKVIARPCFGGGTWPAVMVLAALGLNLLIALAPSSKIDETYYHMLVPQRVVADNGLRPYRLPFEAATYPQMAYQLGLSMVHALKAPEAGNALSWGLSAALIVLIIGTVSQLTGIPRAGWLCGGVAAVGLYTSVWHVTSGAHALGDLAVAVAFTLYLLPEDLIAWVQGSRRLMLICLAGAVGASTKVSVAPICLGIAFLAAYQAVPVIGWLNTAITALTVWMVVYVPLVAWSAIETGSPFGLATAPVFHSKFFSADMVAMLRDIVKASQTATFFSQELKKLFLSVSPAMIFAPLALLPGIRERRSIRTVLGFVVAQIVLIAIFFPYEYRFLGGLEFVVLIMAAWNLSFFPRGRCWLMHSSLLGTLLCLPWLAMQAYYARPFLAVDLGLQTRKAYLRKYVAFTEDFEKLDQILPKDAILFIKTSRPPSVYAPRPIIYSLLDFTGGHPLYRFTVGAAPSADLLRCDRVVYENPQAISLAYRTPGRPPSRGDLRVEHCFVDAQRPPGSVPYAGAVQTR
jgi:hypothetical protein